MKPLKTLCSNAIMILLFAVMSTLYFSTAYCKPALKVVNPKALAAVHGNWTRSFPLNWSKISVVMVNNVKIFSKHTDRTVYIVPGLSHIVALIRFNQSLWQGPFYSVIQMREYLKKNHQYRIDMQVEGDAVQAWLMESGARVSPIYSAKYRPLKRKIDRYTPMNSLR